MKLLKIAFILIAVTIGFITLSQKQYHSEYQSSSPNLIDFFKWKFTRNKPIWPDVSAEIPLKKKVNLPKQVLGKEILVTYINHSSLLIQTEGKNILTDPIWSSHAGPFGKFGVGRSIHPGVDINDLPPIDYILISHAHYDHLDLTTIEALVKTHKPKLLMGLGVARYIDYCQDKQENCYELDWWNTSHFDNLSFHFVPAYHWSSRYFLDKNTSLWGGFIIDNSHDKIYFAGDTGFSDGQIFKDIKAKYGEFRLSLLPIGAYKPGWFFSNMHVSPLEAVKIFKILKSDYAIPIHYDTFELTDDKYTDPLNDLSEALKEEQVPADKFNILKPGQSWQVR